MSGPDLLERTRMALADCGIDPEMVQRAVRSDDVTLPGRATDEQIRMAWRAVTLAKWSAGDPGCCWTCVRTFWDDRTLPEPRDACRAFLPLTEDCGVTR